MGARVQAHRPAIWALVALFLAGALGSVGLRATLKFAILGLAVVTVWASWAVTRTAVETQAATRRAEAVAGA